MEFKEKLREFGYGRNDGGYWDLDGWREKKGMGERKERELPGCCEHKIYHLSSLNVN